MQGGYGPTIYIKDMFGIAGFDLTETVVNMWLVMAFIIIIAIIATRNLKIRPGKVQIIAEMVYNGIKDLLVSSMGEKNLGFLPYMGSLILFLAISNISGVFGLRPATADFNTTFALAILTFILIQSNGIIHKGVGGYLKGYFEPMPFLFPINVIGEVANPISLAFRLFGNIIGGLIIMSLLYSGLSYISGAIINIGVPFLAVGIPVAFHMYFDLFSGLLQSLIFTMLTMVFISMAQE